MMPSITVFNTHIEIYPYHKGDNFALEKSLSKWNKTTHRYIPLAYYIQNDTLYLPRGINLSVLQSTFNVIPAYDKNHTISSNKNKYNIEIKVPPRNRIQEEAIEFLTNTSKNGHQIGLNLDTGDGKTYCMCNAIITMGLTSIVITHKDRIKEQWKSTLLNMFELTEDDVFDITGSEDMEKIVDGTVTSKIYLVNHQTIASYAKTHGWNGVKEFFDVSSICVKVFDESHKFFENALMIDYFSNVSYTYYLTATFARSDARESAIYKSVYSSVKRFGEETLNYEEKRKHIVFVAMYYHTSPTLQDKNSMNTLHGFSSYKFIDYALKEESNTLMRVIEHILSSTSNLKGSTLIISPKIDSCEYIAKEIKKFTDKSVGTVHSRNSKEDNEKNIKKDIICSTIKSIGEGDDIRNLRILINTEPLGSRSLADQLRGRLREFSKTDDTFMFYPIDTSISETTLFFKRILPVMKKKCKEIIITKFSD